MAFFVFKFICDLVMCDGVMATFYFLYFFVFFSKSFCRPHFPLFFFSSLTCDIYASHVYLHTSIVPTSIRSHMCNSHSSHPLISPLSLHLPLPAAARPLNLLLPPLLMMQSRQQSSFPPPFVALSFALPSPSLLF